MLSPNFKKQTAMATAAIAALGMTAGISLVGGSAVNADPQQLRGDNFVTVGSDTTETISNAYTGFQNGENYTPLQSNAGPTGQEFLGYQQMISFDATERGAINTCITPKVSNISWYRPNGSSSGRRALSKSFSIGGGWGNGVNCSVQDISGQVDIARSSSGPGGSSGAGELSYIPMGRDALSLATVAPPAVTKQTQFTVAEIASLYSVGPAVKNGQVVAMCGIQTGSGTNQSWEQFITTTNRTGTAACNAVGIASPLVADPLGHQQENKSVDFASLVDTAPSVSHPDCDGNVGGPAVACTNVQWLVGFAASNYIAAGNGVSGIGFDGRVTFADVETVPGSGTFDGPPVLGAPGSYSPNPAFFSTSFGRDVYYVIPTATYDSLVATTAFGLIEPLESMLVNAGGANGQVPAICEAATFVTLGKFGFAEPAAPCGVEADTGAFLNGST